MAKQITTSTLKGMKVYDISKGKKSLGKIQHFIFHPHKRAVIGFTIKRPDVAWMFHRDDLFVPYDAFEIIDGDVCVQGKELSSGPKTCKKQGINWDECIIWQGMALVTEDGKNCGHVGDVTFSLEDGSVQSLRVDKGISNRALLGTVELGSSMVLGFKQGVGDVISSVETDDEEDQIRGALLVRPEVLTVPAMGGIAEKAGAATAKVAHTAKTAVSQVKDKYDQRKPNRDEATAKAEEAINKGAYKVGEQLGKARGMFGSFKQAYLDALHDDDDRS